MGEHAKNYPPSAAKRWIACPFSATVTPMYPNDDTKQSLKGNMWHELSETLITFGTLPPEADADAAEELERLKEYVWKRVQEGGPGTLVLVERRLDIPQTGEFGTVDILIIAPAWIEVIDLKGGYVPVDVEQNSQELVYLLGAIAEFGSRQAYKLTIFQPNYDHVDGPLRHYNVVMQDLAEIEQQIDYALNHRDECFAGTHCKETYCPHRGACAAFHQYVVDDLTLGWHTSEVKGMDDATLAKALDASDLLGGYRTELRTEAMRRIMNQDRQIDGYKVVKGRRSRAVIKPKELVQDVRHNLGDGWAQRMFEKLGWVELSGDQFANEEVLKHLGTPAHIEGVIKQYARQVSLPRGAWKTVYENLVGAYIRETASGLTLEKAIDGRPAHKRGSEFGTIDPANGTQATTVL